MRVDAHQHFWTYEPAQYPWIQLDWPIRRDFLPPDLEPLLKQAGFDACVAVQARQTLAESRWLLELATRHSFIAGVVGWVDLRSPQIAGQLAEFAAHPKFKGVRHVVQDEPDERFLLRPEFLRGLECLRDFTLTYDLLIFPKQLPAAIELARKFPDQPFVLDHIAKPPIAAGQLEPWANHLRQLAQCPNVSCKISGLVTEASWHEWSPRDFRPYLDIVWEAFGEDRLMLGSDWPVCTLSAEHSRVMGLAADYLAPFPGLTREKVLGANAVVFYRLQF